MKPTYIIILTIIILLLGSLLISRLPHLEEHNNHYLEVYGMDSWEEK